LNTVGATLLMLQSTRAHAAVAGVFFAFGVGVGLWGGAAGSILAHAHVDSAAFGALLTAYTAAYLIAMSAAGAIAHRFGVRRVLRVGAFAFGRRCVRCSTRGPRCWSAAF
jgi:MFS family permease